RSEGKMAGLEKLITLAGRRSDGALATWQRLKEQCDDALRKLSLLKQHRERYRDLLRAGLGEVVLRQESEVGRLEQACARQWQELVERRREKRMYEIVHQKAASREMAAALRRAQAEIDDLLQRVGKTP